VGRAVGAWCREVEILRVAPWREIDVSSSERLVGREVRRYSCARTSVLGRQMLISKKGVSNLGR
jgi:hypothetical protein